MCVCVGGRGGGRDGGEGCVSVTHLCVSSLGLSSSVSTLKAGGGGVKVSQQEVCIYSRINIQYMYKNTVLMSPWKRNPGRDFFTLSES